MPPPVFPLDFDRVEASKPDTVDLYFTLKAENPRNSGASLRLAAYRLSVNGEEAAEGSTLLFPLEETGARLAPLEQGEFPVLLRLEQNGKYETAELTLSLTMDVELSFDNKKKSSASARGTAEFIQVREPVFSITSITILQAELINTRLKVRVRVDNPNFFPVDLSSLKYELYGAGRFWADGMETNACTVPASGFVEQDIFLVMNFINMRRDLLDQIIAMKKIRYRFTGTAEISTAVDYLPVYTKTFDLQGESAVER